MTRNQKIQAALPRIDRIKQDLENRMPNFRLMGSVEEEQSIRDEVLASMWLAAMRETKDESKADQFVEASLVFQSIMLTTGALDESGEIIKKI
uniref:hypothetical protein n=1 Tax=Orrella sp. TaxID=1921583 RepID=UPI00405573F8